MPESPIDMILESPPMLSCRQTAFEALPHRFLAAACVLLLSLWTVDQAAQAQEANVTTSESSTDTVETAETAEGSSSPQSAVDATPSEETSEKKEPAKSQAADVAKHVAEEAQDTSGEGAKSAGPAAQAHAAKFTEWKDLLKSLRKIRAEFAIAETDKLGSLQKEWDTAIEAGKKIERELYDTATSAYAEAPNEDRELTQFLVSAAKDQVARDDFAEAHKILKALVAGGCVEKPIMDLTGRAAYGMNDFDSAAKYLKKASESDSLSNEGSQYLESISSVQETWKKESEIRAVEAKADDLPRVKLITTAGDITLELFENEAPETVGNFISLVEKGFYDQLNFHRVLPGFMAQGGCPKGDGTGDPGYMIYCECVNDNHRNHFAGSLSMAKSSARNTGGSQFFINFIPTPFLNGEHTVFGRVIEGWDVLPKIVRIDPQGKEANQATPTMIEKAEVVRKREHEYRPNKVN